MNMHMNMRSGRVKKAISSALFKLRKDQPKKGVDLLSLARKLSAKKFKKAS